MEDDVNYNTGLGQNDANVETHGSQTTKYYIPINAEPFADDLDGTLEENLEELQQVNSALGLLSNASGEAPMNGDGSGLVGSSDLEHMDYEAAFKTKYKQNGGEGRIELTGISRFPTENLGHHPFLGEIKLEKEGYELNRRDQQALQEAIDSFLAHEVEKKDIRNLSCKWEENDKGNIQLRIDHVIQEEIGEWEAPIETVVAESLAD